MTWRSIAKEYVIKTGEENLRWKDNMWNFARFGNIGTIYKTWKHPWRSIKFSKVADLQVSGGNTPPWLFFMFFKLGKWYQIAQSITY